MPTLFLLRLSMIMLLCEVELEESILRSDDVIGMLTYCVSISQTFVNRTEYRCRVVTRMRVETRRDHGGLGPKSK